MSDLPEDIQDLIEAVDKSGRRITFNPNRDIRKHNINCYNSIDENTSKYFGKNPEKMICTLEDCNCRCHVNHIQFVTTQQN